MSALSERYWLMASEEDLSESVLALLRAWDLWTVHAGVGGLIASTRVAGMSQLEACKIARLKNML